MWILVAEDEPSMGHLLVQGLEEQNHTVILARDGEEALSAISTSAFDAIVLDVMMPRVNGLEVARRLRTAKNHTPILMLTARDASEDIVRGLDAGADDYLVKPFALKVLMARLRAISRRAVQSPVKELRAGDLCLDPATREVSRDGRTIPITPTEFRLLELLMRRANRAVSRTSIIEAVWGFNEDVESNTVDVYIKLLREKVDNDINRRLIHTVRGFGYILRDEVKRRVSIQFRLTASYTAILALTFALIGVGVWFALEHSIEETADRELHSRLADVRRYVDSFTPDDLTHLENEFREEALLTPSAANIRIADANGRWLFRTPGSEAWPRETIGAASLPERGVSRTIRVRHELIRLLIAPVRVGFVEIGLPIDEFEEVKDGFIWLIALGSPVVLLLAGLGGYWMAGRALEPIHESFRRVTEFTADASHELRTPVAIIQTTAELMLARPRTQEEHTKAWTAITNETGRTSRLIADLLTLARADAGKVDFDLLPINLLDIVREAADEMRIMAESKGLEMQLLSSEACGILGDSEALRRAVCILLDNAIKFTSAPGRVTVAVRGGVRCSVTISDTGVGIAPPDLPNIFKRFYRVSKDRSRTTGGAGLGLSIANSIVERHHGEIRAESTFGKGSTFTILISSADRQKPKPE